MTSKSPQQGSVENNRNSNADLIEERENVILFLRKTIASEKIGTVNSHRRNHELKNK